MYLLCRCLAGYNGERCEHLTLNSYAHNSYERYIAVGIGVGILTSGILAIIYCYVRKRYGKSEPSGYMDLKFSGGQSFEGTGTVFCLLLVCGVILNELTPYTSDLWSTSEASVELSETWGSSGLPKWVRGVGFGSVQAAAVSGLADGNHMMVSILDAGSWNPPTRCAWVRRRCESLVLYTHQFACWGGRACAIGPVPRPRWGHGLEGTAEERAKGAPAGLTGSVLLTRFPLLGEGGSCSGPSSWGHWQASQHCAVPTVCHGEDWLVLAVFSHFKHSCSVLLWSFVCLVWFCCFLFSPVEDKHPLPHSGAVFWTFCTDHKPFGFWFWCLLAVCMDKQPFPDPAVSFGVLGQVWASGAIKDKKSCELKKMSGSQSHP